MENNEAEDLIKKIFGDTESVNEDGNGIRYFTCKCGRIEHRETIVDGIPTIICECGEIYYTASAVRLMEQQNK
ncbi:hypothetical protein IJ21_20010 [Paenibacillus sp. 32O-W]|uniref:hypothetical protein n=1 Tax=Paenibacillus sp. 32O-W TaxID=1695218 RepID=UPI000722B091|nr:hypothetical protein [Paenibacillus sp. 32O-W]ALS27399.1 hypothetical protein IJ21_20010 [Paenibacillus sp. 32O-W]